MLSPVEILAWRALPQEELLPKIVRSIIAEARESLDPPYRTSGSWLKLILSIRLELNDELHVLAASLGVDANDMMAELRQQLAVMQRA